jgi:FKBP-type peptidyl-prolyl cis-trans isomerase
MKKYILISYLTIVCASFSVFAQADEVASADDTIVEQSAGETADETVDGTADEIADETMRDERGYFFGYSFGNMLKEGGNLDVNLDFLLKGLQDSIDGKNPDLTSEQQQGVIDRVRVRQQELASQKESDANRAVIDNLESAKVFMAENGSKPNIKTTSSGLQYEHLSSGKGAKPHLDATVVVHYEGKLSTGKIFDSSIQRGTPAEFGLTQVIPGWTEGLQLMKVGGKTRFFIPPDLGYGPGGTRGIPPNSVLIFEVELLEIKKPKA